MNKTKELIQNKFTIKNTNYQNNDDEDNDKNIRDFTKYDVDSIQNFYIEDKDKDNDNVNNNDNTNIIYYGDQLLKKSNTDNLNFYIKNKTIHICVYRLITEHIKPFVMFLLYKEDGTTLSLPTIVESDTIVEDTLKKMNNIFTSFRNENADSSTKLNYKGFIDNDDNNIYIILECKDKNNKLNLNTNWWWALSTEIVNYKKILNFDINYNVTQFFLNNIELLFINNTFGHQYECPSVGYYGDKYEYTQLTFSLGRNRNDDLNSEFGPFYSFETYDNAIKHVLSIKEKGGLVRFALFIGKTKVLKENDTMIDNQLYDSITKKSTIVVKTYEQQIPLAHYCYNNKLYISC